MVIYRFCVAGMGLFFFSLGILSFVVCTGDWFACAMDGAKGIFFVVLGTAMFSMLFRSDEEMAKSLFHGFWRDLVGRENVRHMAWSVTAIATLLAVMLAGHHLRWWPGK